MKYLNWMLFTLIIFFFIPAIALIASAVNKYGDKAKGEEPLSLYSFGALLKYMDTDNLVTFDSREDYIIGYCVGLAFGICVTFIFIQIIRKKLNTDVDVIDKLSFTPSDFCVIGFCPEFSEECDYSIQGIRDEIERVFKEKYEIDGVEYVNVAYDIENVFELHNEMRMLMKKRELINWYMEKKGWSEEQYKENCGKFEDFDDFPAESEGLFGCFAKTPLDLDFITSEIERVEAAIDDIEATASVAEDGSSREERMEKYTGKVFVVLKRDDQMQKVVDSVGDNLLVKFYKIFCSCFFDSSSLWEFYRAPEPSDINW